PRKLEQLVAREDALRRRKERREDAEFAVGEIDRLAFRAFQLAQADIQLPAGEAVGAYTREQLARAEGLGEVVVGAELEPHHAVGFLGAPGEHEDRDARGLVAQAARDLQA